jgi:hypothetical protein
MAEKRHQIRSARGLPAPRLELRWKRVSDFEWLCDYNLVIRLDGMDIRRENDNGKVVRSEKTVMIGQTRSTGNSKTQVGPDWVHTPFRDGAHAWWDSKQLGNLPVYAISEGKAQLQAYREDAAP